MYLCNALPLKDLPSDGSINILTTSETYPQLEIANPIAVETAGNAFINIKNASSVLTGARVRLDNANNTFLSNDDGKSLVLKTSVNQYPQLTMSNPYPMGSPGATFINVKNTSSAGRGARFGINSGKNTYISNDGGHKVLV